MKIVNFAAFFIYDLAYLILNKINKIEEAKPFLGFVDLAWVLGIDVPTLVLTMRFVHLFIKKIENKKKDDLSVVYL